VGSSGALVDKDTGVTLRTAPGIVTVNYGLVNATLVRRLSVPVVLSKGTAHQIIQQYHLSTVRADISV
jgi:phosphohistidine swiveling domain-containing protein